MKNNDFEIVKIQNDSQKAIAFKDVIFDLRILLEYANILARESLLRNLADRLFNSGYGRLDIVNTKTASNNTLNWNQSGIEAAILDPEVKGWKKGKARIRVVLEFCPDEEPDISLTEDSPLADNSLDTIRQNIS